MSKKELKNKPLAEVILEMKWALTSPAPGVQIDPHYKILLGRFYDKVSGEYPEHEQLQTATMPDEIAGQMVQHRFRIAPNEWPLLQIGPGIMTVNETHKYKWLDFRSRSVAAIDKLFNAHPKPRDLKIDSLLLRYIDAVEFNYSKQHVFEFLKDKMKFMIALPDSLFKDTKIQKNPQHFSWQSSFGCQNPGGIITLRFATGKKDNLPSLIWETIVHSRGEDIPSMPQMFERWVDEAHAITDDWFFKIIEGELERRFSG